MMALRTSICNCFAFSNHSHLFNFKPNPLPHFSCPKTSSSSSTSVVPKASSVEKHGDMTRRNLSLTIAAVFLNGFFPNLQKAILADEMEQLKLERYTDSTEGFTLLRPSCWIKVEKAGATLLFEEPNNGSNNVGVVVNPVRLTSLAEFGTPQFVADKLIQAERRKESTKDAEVIGCAERSGQGGLQVYEFEYKVDSTRGGMKRIFSAAFVASKKLYLVNITHSDKLESPLSSHTRTMLEQVLHSFDAAPLT